MSLSSVLAPQVSSRSRSLGRQYWSRGAVRTLNRNGTEVRATVLGNGLYDVRLTPVEDYVRVSCTCPYFLDHLEICKHIWAAILAAEEKSLSFIPPDVPIDEIDLDPIDPIDPEPDLSTREHFSYRAQPAPRTRRRERWQDVLDSVLHAAGPGASPMAAAKPFAGQLFYAVDVAAAVARQALVLQLVARDRKANGEWSKPRSVRLPISSIPALPDADDRQILERLLGARPAVNWAWSYAGHEFPSPFHLHGLLVTELIPVICSTGRGCLQLSEYPGMRPEQTTLLPLAWDAGAAWSFKMNIQRDDTAGVYVVDGRLERDGGAMPVTEPALVLTEGLLFTQTHAARLDHGGAFQWLAELRRAGAVTVPCKRRAELLDALLASEPPTASVPDELRVQIDSIVPRPHLQITAASGLRDRLLAEVSFDYAGVLVAPESQDRIVRIDNGSRASRRDFDAERRAIELLRTAGARPGWDPHSSKSALQIPPSRLPRIVAQLLDEGWRVQADGRRYRMPAAPVALEVHSGIDWFELHGHADFDDQTVLLPALLAALQRGESSVVLDDGSVGMFPDDWLRKYGGLAHLGTPTGAHVRFKPSQVALLDALLAAQPAVSWDEASVHAREQLHAFEGIGPLDPPAAFAGTLRGYQRDGLGWLVFLQRFRFGGCLADDMGLGKTVMVLALLETRREAQRSDPDGRRPTLVVAPRSVVFNWRQEAARFTPALRVLEYSGSAREEMRTRLADADVVLTTYGTLRRDAARLADQPFDYVVLDEAQAIKNAGTASAKASRLLNARHRLALSGTPIENHVGELWSLFEFLNPGLLGSARAFGRASGGRAADDDQIAVLARGLRPFILRRTKEQVASDLPPKVEQTIVCELEPPQRVLYDELRDHYRRTLLDRDQATLKRSTFQVLEALLRLRQAACHPGLIDPKRVTQPSAKLDVLVPRLIETLEEGHKALVFSQFTSFLAILRRTLDAEGIRYAYLDGQTRDREAKVEEFQADPECRLFLISLKAGGLGLNLTAADSVFLLDPWWNPAVEAQAIDRTHRIGQSRHVFAYRLIARDTVEERVLELQQRKRKLADAILTESTGVIRDLRREDLELLLS